MNRKGFSRRSFLEIASMFGGGLALKETFLGNAWAAPGDEPKFMLIVYFSGGWDQLLALDPRDQKDPAYQLPLAATKTGSGIFPAYEENADADTDVESVMAATGRTGVQTAGALTFGPAVAPPLIAHAPDLCIVRGMNMDTLTHEVGRRYLITGKFPRGLAASGSSLDTVVTAQTMSTLDLPNLVIGGGTETYNESYDAFASGVRVNTAADVRNVLQPQAITGTLTAASETQLANFEKSPGADTCEAHGYDATGLVKAFRASRDQARKMTNSAVSKYFDFKIPATAETADAFTHFNITSTAQFNLPAGRAAVAAQAMAQGTSQVVAVTLAEGLDDHFDLYGQQSTTQRAGWDALGKLISWLKSKPAPGSPTGKTLWQCCTLMTFSEFSRTPMINPRDGRDHHLASSCLIAGPGIKGNTVFGKTLNVGMATSKWNFTTGAEDTTATGNIIRPADVHATLLKSMKLAYSHLSNQSAKAIDKILT